MSKEAVSLTVDQLKELLVEMRKPVLTEEDIRRIEAKKQEAEEGAAMEKERQDRARAAIAFCDHMKARPWNQEPAAVYVKGCGDPGSGDFFMCQHCQGRIHRAESRNPNWQYDSVRDVFNTDEYNRLWRATFGGGGIIG